MAATSLLSETGFGGSERVIDWKGTGPLTEHWQCESRPNEIPGEHSARISPETGITLSWEGPVDRVRLLQFINHTSIEPSPQGYVVQLQASFSHDRDLLSKIEWIALLEEQADARSLYFLKKLAFSSIALPGGIAIIGSAHIDRFDPTKRFALCFQFKPTARTFTVSKVELTASAADRSYSRPAPARPAGFVNGTSASSPPQSVAPPKPTTPIAQVASTPRVGTPAKSTGPVGGMQSAPTAPNTPTPTALAHAPQLAARLAPTTRKRAVVIAWDMGHNPVGRAFLLADVLRRSYDVVLIGPLFKRFGGKVWPPVSQSGIEIHTFPAESTADFLASALEFVSLIEADVVYACKARLPSMLLGLLIKHRTGCPVVLDVDDHELSFFADAQPLSLEALTDQITELKDLEEPFGHSWTRLCEYMIPFFDSVTVSNVALQERFGGVIIGHARDEMQFGANREIRNAIRAEFGFKSDDRVVLFLGTPRAHKGIFRLAAAIERLADPRLALCIIGSPNDKRIENQLAGYKGARISTFPDQPWARLQELINLADGVCLLQDPASPIAHYQMPAKLTDALSTCVPVAVTDVAPFKDIPSPSIVVKIRNEEDLENFLKGVADGSAGQGDFRARARSYFMTNLSYSAVGARLLALFDELRHRPPVWPAELSELLALLARRSGLPIPHRTPSWAEETECKPAIRRDRPIDLAFFWKQNDTGIYGRRHDMLLKYLSRHPRIGRIVQFDAPLPVGNLTRGLTDRAGVVDQGNLVAGKTIERYLRAADSDNIARRVFIYSEPRNPQKLLGGDLATLADYPDWVRKTLREVGPERDFVSWVAPVVFDYPRLHDEIRFRASIVDIIDDERKMARAPERVRRVSETYEQTLKRADIVFANCNAAAEAFAEQRRDITVVPNAAEILPPRNGSAPKPFELRHLKGPIIGYVGNLRDRIDVGLLARMSRERPDWQIVLIGSAHGEPEVLRLRGRPNVHFLGVRPYDVALDYIRAFDVAIMPHLNNEISAAMNPLKLYVYCSVGVPVVTTAVRNIEEMSRYVHVAADDNEFIAHIETVLERGSNLAGGLEWSLPAESSWNNRVEAIIAAIDARGV